MNKTPEQWILELEQKSKVVRTAKSLLRKAVDIAQKKAIFFNIMVDIAEKEFKMLIRKKIVIRTIDQNTSKRKRSISKSHSNSFTYTPDRHT